MKDSPPSAGGEDGMCRFWVCNTHEGRLVI